MLFLIIPRETKVFFSEPGRRRRRDSNPGDIGERRWPPLLPKHMYNIYKSTLLTYANFCITETSLS